MKVSLLCIITIILLLTSISSCDKMPMNGDLDGMWQLMSEETADSTTDLKSTRHYISFQLHTAQFSTLSNSRCFYSRFIHEGSTLQFVSICTNSTNATSEDDNIPISSDSIQQLHPWGIYEIDPTFSIVTLNASTLILESPHSRLRFRKF